MLKWIRREDRWYSQHHFNKTLFIFQQKRVINMLVSFISKCYPFQMSMDSVFPRIAKCGNCCWPARVCPSTSSIADDSVFMQESHLNRQIGLVDRPYSSHFLSSSFFLIVHWICNLLSRLVLHLICTCYQRDQLEEFNIWSSTYNKIQLHLPHLVSS